MATRDLTQDTINGVINENAIVIVDFWAPWCAPCRSFGPIFEAVSEKHPDIVFGKVNTEEEQELAAALAIRSIPTVVVFREKVVIYNDAGALPENALEHLIDQVRSVDMSAIHAEIASREQD